MAGSKFQHKALVFTVALQNAYKDEDNREDVGKLELTEEEATEDFTAMLVAMSIFYEGVSGDDCDLIGFTHILNRLAIQHAMNKGDE